MRSAIRLFCRCFAAAWIAALCIGSAAAQSALDDAIRQLLEQDSAIPAPRETEPRDGAILRGLDTFSGQVETFTLPVGETARYARLDVRLLACHSVEGAEDAFAFLEIVDTKTPDIVAFRGWMIASSPALSALDHPRYDVWLQSCSTEAPEAP